MFLITPVVVVASKVFLLIYCFIIVVDLNSTTKQLLSDNLDVSIAILMILFAYNTLLVNIFSNVFFLKNKYEMSLYK